MKLILRWQIDVYKRQIFILSHNEDMLYQLISSGLQCLSEYMSIYTTEDFRGMKVVSSPSVSVGVALKSDLLELQIHSDEMSREELAYLSLIHIWGGGKLYQDDP